MKNSPQGKTNKKQAKKRKPLRKKPSGSGKSFTPAGNSSVERVAPSKHRHSEKPSVSPAKVPLPKRPKLPLPLTVGLLFIGAFVFLLVLILIIDHPEDLNVSPSNMSTDQKGSISEQEADGPGGFLTSYFQKMDEKDYAGMYEDISEDSKMTIDKETFIEKHTNIFEGIVAENIQISVENVILSHGETYTVVYQTQMNSQAGLITFSNFSDVEKVEDEYKIVWDTTCIFPQLKDNYRVHNKKITAERGNIYDRNDYILAGSGTASSVGMVPGKMNGDPQEDIRKVSEILGISRESIQGKLNEDYVTDDTFVPLRTIPDSEGQKIKALLEIDGVQINPISTRVYPMGETAAHIIGYVQPISAEELEEKEDMGYDQSSFIGKMGLELMLEERLRPKSGREIEIVNEGGAHVATLALEAPQNGESIRLTIDANLQSYIHSILAEEKSSTVAMNPTNGEILALVSTPSYDPESFSMGLLDEEWEIVRDDPANPMFARFRARYVPGSSFKPVTAAVGITSGKVDPEEDFGTSGRRWRLDASWGGYHVTTLASYTGPANTSNALIYSDNIYFAKTAVKIGANMFSQYLTDLGFGKSFPFEMDLDSSSYEEEEDWFSSSMALADTGYGQSQLLLNPIHFSALYSTFSNDGDMIAPHIILDDDNRNSHIWKEGAFSGEAVSVVRDALEQVVKNPWGTGHNAYIRDIALAGKTGTAEIKLTQADTTGTELGWFAAFTLDRNQSEQIQVITMIEDVKARGGSHFVVPFVKDIVEYYVRAEKE